MNNPWPISDEKLDAKYAEFRLLGSSKEQCEWQMEDWLHNVVCNHINRLLALHPKQAGRRSVEVNYKPAKITIKGVFYLDDLQVRMEHTSEVFKPKSTGFDWGEIINFINSTRGRNENKYARKKRSALL